MTGKVRADGYQRLQSEDRRGLEVVAVGVLASVLALCLMVWLDNVHINTANGLFKSVAVSDWKADFRSAPLDPSNYLYFPTMAAFCRLLDWLGVYAGTTWKQMAVVSTIFAGVAVASVFVLVRNLTGQFYAAVAAAIFHLGSAYFLSLAVSNEDIMPSYTFVLVAMVMAAIWFRAPTIGQVAVVAAVFTLGWLGEWRLIFPALPPLLLALALSPGTLRRRAGLVLWFVLVMVAVAFLVVKCTEGHVGAVGLLDLFWTGKGVGTGWGGFSPDKLSLVPFGMGEYLLGGLNLSFLPLTGPQGMEWSAAFAVELLLLAAVALLFWRHRRDAKLRAAAIIFLGALAAGEVMNAYSQPSDPQMQLNVMPWLTVAIGLFVADSLRTRHLVATLAVLAISALPLAYNVRVFAEMRGFDGRMTAAMKQLHNLADPAHTAFIYTGFQIISTWQYATLRTPGEQRHLWGMGLCELGPAPQDQPKFKWLAIFAPIIYHPELTDDEYLKAIKTELDCAFDKGYRVVVAPFWTESTELLANGMAMLNARSRAPALHAMFQTYPAKPIGPRVGNEGVYLEITRP